MNRRALAIVLTIALVAGTGFAAEPREHQLTIVVLGRDGKPAVDHRLFLADYDTGAEQTPSDPSGRVRITTPRGRYYLHATIESGERTDRVTAPWLAVHRDTTIILDARTTGPIDVTVPHRGAKLFNGVIGGDMITRTGVPRVIIPGLPLQDFTRVGTAQAGPDAPAGRFVGSMQVTLAKPDPDGGFLDSPYSYTLAWFTKGRPYTGSRAVGREQLAEVRTSHRPLGGHTRADKLALAAHSRQPEARIPFGAPLPVRLPGVRTEYYTTTGVEWMIGLEPEFDPQNPPSWAQQAVARRYEAGQRYSETWNGGGVFGPSLPPADPPGYAKAGPNGLSIRVPMHGTAPDVMGFITADRALTAVHHNGLEVCISDRAGSCYAEGAPRPGVYRMSTEVEQSQTPFSPKIVATWTFRYDGGDTTVALPIQVIRFDPANRLNITVQRNPGAAHAAVVDSHVEVSYDDGVTWQHELTKPHDGWVSLRGRVVDSAGNTAELTVIRAYRASSV